MSWQQHQCGGKFARDEAILYFLDKGFYGSVGNSRRLTIIQSMQPTGNQDTGIIRVEFVVRCSMRARASGQFEGRPGQVHAARPIGIIHVRQGDNDQECGK